MGGLRPRPVPSSLCQLLQPTQQWPVYQLLLVYDRPLLCGFSVAIKWLSKQNINMFDINNKQCSEMYNSICVVEYCSYTTFTN